MVQDARVVLLADSTDSRNKDPLSSRSGRADQNGKFQLSGIIPGLYRIYAWSAPHSAGAFLDDSFMKEWIGHGITVPIKRGDQISLDLKIIDEQSTRR